jgi:hypothetical protein
MTTESAATAARSVDLLKTDGRFERRRRSAKNRASGTPSSARWSIVSDKVQVLLWIRPIPRMVARVGLISAVRTLIPNDP